MLSQYLQRLVHASVTIRTVVPKILLVFWRGRRRVRGPHNFRVGGWRRALGWRRMWVRGRPRVHDHVSVVGVAVHLLPGVHVDWHRSGLGRDDAGRYRVYFVVVVILDWNTRNINYTFITEMYKPKGSTCKSLRTRRGQCPEMVELNTCVKCFCYSSNAY